MEKEVVEFPSDSKIWGPGMWFNLHMEGKNAINIKLINNYVEYLNRILYELPCMTCREHATKYLSDNPPDKYIDIKDNNGNFTGMFMWSWSFHNAVNTRLGKRTIEYDIAWDIYEDNEFCTDSCGN